MRVTIVAADRLARDEASLLRHKIDITVLINERMGRILETALLYNVGGDLYTLRLNDQAEAYISNPGAHSFTLLSADVGNRGATVLAVAQDVIFERQMFEYAFGELEGYRMIKNILVLGSTSKAEVDAQYDDFFSSTEGYFA